MGVLVLHHHATMGGNVSMFFNWLFCFFAFLAFLTFFWLLCMSSYWLHFGTFFTLLVSFDKKTVNEHFHGAHDSMILLDQHSG